MGPRYLGLDPNRPFVAISASDRPLGHADADGLTNVALAQFAAFSPGFVSLWTKDPIGSWPGATHAQRQLVGPIGALRNNPTPPELTLRPRRDTDFYPRYRSIHDAHVCAEAAHAEHARLESETFLNELAEQGTLFDVMVVESWAGIVAAEPDQQRGVVGATVVELLLDQEFRGRGSGRHLSTLLAQELSLPDSACLIGTIHADNTSAYRAAIAAGRVDVGGEFQLSC